MNWFETIFIVWLTFVLICVMIFTAFGALWLALWPYKLWKASRLEKQAKEGKIPYKVYVDYLNSL